MQAAAQLRAKAASTTFPAEREALLAKAAEIEKDTVVLGRKGMAEEWFGGLKGDIYSKVWTDPIKTTHVDVAKVRKWPKADEHLQEHFDMGVTDVVSGRVIHIEVDDVAVWLKWWLEGGGKVSGPD